MEYIDNENVVVLLDENGEEQYFEHELTFLYEGDRYAALSPITEYEDDGEEDDLFEDEESEILFMRIDRDDAGDSYTLVENEIMLDELFTRFIELMDEIEEQNQEE